MKNGIPKILLLGNGINRAFHSDSWDALLNTIDIRRERYDIGEFRCPETLKAILITGDNVDKALENEKERLGALGTKKPAEQLALLRRLLEMDFDEILTTNYSYELESAALGKEHINEHALRRMQRHTAEVPRCETRFMLHTYNSVQLCGKEQHIWHIHGEARKPGSMILGAYYYGNLLGKITELDRRRGTYFTASEHAAVRSWTDAFILGEVYILGFGFGFAETDLWWLLNRKKRERAAVGKTYFYELKPPSETNRAKLDLLRLMNVEIVYIGTENGDWRGAYTKAVEDIEKRMKKTRKRS